ncbi:MAG: alpha/beta hydrolase [Tractidigestivibacter sp.]|jgi:predicted alpha/beta superfamily hydrolase|uniref:alpha/beta hydrolase n=1 Tax=Tractidigestivibacter sp. TaxID=2847320 RepID=UPI003D8B7325
MAKSTKRFSLDRYQICVAPATTAGAPVVYLNMYEDETDQTLDALASLGCPDVALIGISNIDWGRDMTPWEAPSAFERNKSYGGRADGYLELLVSQIAPSAEAELGGEPAWRGLAGYSLAGLFACYAPYKSTFFSRVASMSGSLWYPNFLEFATSHDMARVPERAYLSVGSKESHTRNQATSTVRDRTEAFRDYLESVGARASFELNPGGHFKDICLRTAKGIMALADKAR